ncbi:hypothetical protein [Brevibacillus sp. SYSU BS000544]|uniref:hypothetical protein n=1 Tax=Brevibacillus sp. SYSU BS000544 TaxID=3416443 RepID=UPI003CE57115
MPVFLFSLFLLLFTSIIGTNHVDTANTMAKRTWLQDQVDMALFHASIVPVDDGLTEGLVEIRLDEARQRYYERLQQNGGLTQPSPSSPIVNSGEKSVTMNPVAMQVLFISAEEARSSWDIIMRFTGTSWQEVSRIDKGTGGELVLRIITKSGKTLMLPPKYIQGPSLVAVAYADEPPLNPYAGESEIPIVSVQSIYEGSR